MLPVASTETPSSSGPTFPPTLADLSRHTSVISSSSDSESVHEMPATPRPRPTRTFSSPRSRSPHSPSTVRPPSYLARELAVSDREPRSRSVAAHTRSKSRRRSRSQNPSANNRPSPQDFAFMSTLGEGSYSTVMRARYIRTGQEYAIKIIDKNHLIRKDKLAVAMAEKNVLVKLGTGHPGIIHLHWTFQDEWSLFFVLDLATNGEMQSRVSRLGSLSLACARHYTAQIIDALDYIHSKDVIHRDLKPENLLLDGEFRIKITDFGTGKLLEPGQERANSWVGTAQYIAPELLERSETSKSSDLWSLGCIVYQMIAGRFAFHGLSEYLTWQKIKALDYTFPEGFDEQAKDFVQQLLILDPTQRLGAGAEGSPISRIALRSHPFLASVKWETLWSDPVPPLEAGLVKKEVREEASNEGDGGRKLENVGSMWDALVGGEGIDGSSEISWDDGGGGEGSGRVTTAWREVGRRPSRRFGRSPKNSGDNIHADDDGLGWAQDAEGPEFERFRLRESQLLMRCDEGDEDEAEDTRSGRQRAEVDKVEDAARTPTPTFIQGVQDIVDQASNKDGSTTATTMEMQSIPISTLISPPSPMGTPRLSPSPLGSSSGSGSGTNSLGGSFVEVGDVQPKDKLDNKTTQSTVDDALSRVAGLSLGNGENTKERVAVADGSAERGRDRTLTPVQGNTLLMGKVDWSPILIPDERVIFHTRVEARSPKRRGSRLLLPLNVVSTVRSKPRELVLTNHRLLCVKRREASAGSGSTATSSRDAGKSNGNANGVRIASPGVSFRVKTELWLARVEGKGRDNKDGKDREREKEKETKSVVESTERKGDREFVILTSTTSQTYAAETSALSAQWVEKINASLSSRQEHAPRKR
ncbi:kinase-like domain-containing protein [Pisolithus marmoratus]|nr:kinase-like domain-containing protein [Pisolithus marmoratus]